MYKKGSNMNTNRMFLKSNDFFCYKTALKVTLHNYKVHGLYPVI